MHLVVFENILIKINPSLFLNYILNNPKVNIYVINNGFYMKILLNLLKKILSSLVDEAVILW